MAVAFVTTALGVDGNRYMIALAADHAGKGLVHTWPGKNGIWAPPVTIDHVLVEVTRFVVPAR